VLCSADGCAPDVHLRWDFDPGLGFDTCCKRRDRRPWPLPALKSLTAGGKDYLLFTLTFPATAPGNLAVNPTACSGTGATENMEGCTSVLTYNFLANPAGRIGSIGQQDA